MRPISLRTMLGVLLLLFAAIVIGASVSLVLLTEWFHRSSVELGHSIESIRLEVAIEEVLLHDHTVEEAVRVANREAIRQDLVEAARIVTSGGEARVLSDAVSAVEAYFQAVDSQAEPVRGLEFERAIAELHDLASINLSQAQSARRAAARLDRMANGLAIATASMLLVLAALAIWWINLAFRPIVTLVRTMDRFGRGDLEVRAPETGLAELREMARRFNEMGAAIARQRESQFAFVAGVAHDLRTPLSAMSTAVGLVRPGCELPPEAALRASAEVLQRQLGHLNRMLGDFLDIARIESGRVDLTLSDQDLRRLASEVIALFAPSCPAHELTLQVPDEPVVARCDATRMAQVLVNLVSNAIKYSPAGGEVSVAVEGGADTASLLVTDHGMGIPRHEHDWVFEPFRRGNDNTGGIPGTGMGLFVARRIVEAHRGRIEVDSEPGKGATFRVELPRAASPGG